MPPVDTIGTESEAIAVRGLSLSHVRMARLIGGELRTGLPIGLVLALLAFPMVWLAFGELRLAAAVTIALAGASALASVLGLLLPWVLGPLRIRPSLRQRATGDDRAGRFKPADLLRGRVCDRALRSGADSRACAPAM